MKAGKLFEAALKQADLDLREGIVLHIHVRGKGSRLRLVVASPVVTDFETIILERARKVPDGKAAYHPKISTGEIIRSFRETAGLSITKLAEKAQLSKGSLCSIEKGERPVGLTVLKKIAAALDIPLSLLLKE